MGRVGLTIKPRAEMEFSYPEKEAGKNKKQKNPDINHCEEMQHT